VGTINGVAFWGKGNDQIGSRPPVGFRFEFVSKPVGNSQTSVLVVAGILQKNPLQIYGKE
jgi:hypothetical protein